MVRNCLTKFILTAQDGTIYSFGTDTASNNNGFTSNFNFNYFSTGDSSSVEFCRVGAGFGPGGGNVSERDGGTVPVSWYLTKIQSPTGDVISFKYTRDGPQVIANTVTFGTFSECPTCSPNENYIYGAGDEVSILDGVTLSSITGANGSVQFIKSPANIMDYTLLGAITAPQNIAWTSTQSGLFFAYTNEVFQQASQPSSAKSIFMELDNISVNDSNNVPLKTFAFNYLKSPYNRLFLNSISQIGSDGTTIPPYTFSYNNIAGLYQIPYNTVQVDHWGYYDAVNPYTGLFTTGYPTTGNPFISGAGGLQPIYQTLNSSTLTYSTAFNSSFNSLYTANRTPVNGPMEYGLLQQINYPTGGNTQFLWEPNYYSKFLLGTSTSSSITFSIQDLGSNTIGGGVRIHQINSQDNLSTPLLSKTYTYFRDYVNNNFVSSGVLNSAQPSYTDAYASPSNYLYRDWSNYSVNANHYTDGAPITYSNVQVANSDGSFKTYTYSNQDNGFFDRFGSVYLLSTFPTIGPAVQALNLNSLELDRGLLLNESSYAVGSILLEKKGYTYNNDTTRFNTNIRKYSYAKKFSLDLAIPSVGADGFLTILTGPPNYFSDITSGLNTYIDFPFLKSLADTIYDQNGSNPLAMGTTYTYDNYRNNKTLAFNTSKGESLNTSFNYAADNISGLSVPAQQAQTALVTSGMIGIPLEKTTSRNSSQTEHTRIDYQSYLNAITMLVPATSFLSNYGSPLDSSTHYINYDSKGNILEYIGQSGIPTSFDWGYNQAYPTAKIVNAFNSLSTYFIPTPSTTSNNFIWSAGVFASQNGSFKVTTPGTISLSANFSQFPGSAYYTFGYTITGPVNESGSICIAGSGVTGCGSVPSSVSFSSMPVGTYTIQIFPNSNFSIGTSLTYTYPILTYVPATTGAKEYFYDGFEENANASVVSGSAHTGNKYWGASSYTTSFSPPDSKKYIIQWFNLQAGVWNFNQQVFTTGMVLTGPVDDIRIFPWNALMSTFTYQPIIGKRSEIAPNGSTNYYQYDGFGRVQLIRDKDSNIIKKYDYEFSQLTSPVLNILEIGTFQKSCAAGYIGSSVTDSVLAGKYSSYISQLDANQKAINDVNANGQTNANLKGTCTASIIISGQTFFSLSSPRGSGTITGPPGYTTTVNISASGPPGNTYSISASVSGGATASGSITNGFTSFTFVMPASGSVTWSASCSFSNSSGSGSISVQ
jgi:hypothetical protein